MAEALLGTAGRDGALCSRQRARDRHHLVYAGKLNCLAMGFLHSEGFITSLDEIAMMRICLEESVADVRDASASRHADEAYSNIRLWRRYNFRAGNEYAAT